MLGPVCSLQFSLLAFVRPSSSSWFRYRLVSILRVSFALSFCFIASGQFAGYFILTLCLFNCCLSVALHFTSLCFALLRFGSPCSCWLFIESLKIKFSVLKLKSRKGCDYSLCGSDTDCAMLLSLKKAKFIRYSAARPFFHWFGLSRAWITRFSLVKRRDTGNDLENHNYWKLNHSG